LSLLDTIRANLSKPAKEAVQTDDLTSTIQSATTGKAATSAGPQADRMQEQVAVQQNKAEQQQVRMDGMLAAADIENKFDTISHQKEMAEQQLASQKQISVEQLQAQKIDAGMKLNWREELSGKKRDSMYRMETARINHQSRKAFANLASEYETTTEDIFSQFAASTKELAFRKDAAELEQIGFTMALQNRQYVENINQIAQERRLTDAVSFAEETQRLILGEELLQYAEEIGFREIMDMSDRDFKDEMANINIEQALEMASMMNKSNAEMMKYEAIGGIASGAVQIAGAMARAPKDGET